MHYVMVCTLALSISLSRWSSDPDLGHIVPYDFGLSSRTASGTRADAEQRKKTRNTFLIFSNVSPLAPESRPAYVIYNARKHSRSSNAPWKVRFPCWPWTNDVLNRKLFGLGPSAKPEPLKMIYTSHSLTILLIPTIQSDCASCFKALLMVVLFNVGVIIAYSFNFPLSVCFFFYLLWLLNCIRFIYKHLMSEKYFCNVLVLTSLVIRTYFAFENC